MSSRRDSNRGIARSDLKHYRWGPPQAHCPQISGSMIEFRTLGTVELAGPEAPALRTVMNHPKRIGLLAYLALSGSFQPRSTLVRLFWPTADQAHARTSLRQAIHHLRRTLGPRVLVSRGDDELGVEPEVLHCDAVAFDECYRNGNFSQALDLYRGDFLSGLRIAESPEFGIWLEQERTRLRGMAEHAELAVSQARQVPAIVAGAETRRAAAATQISASGILRVWVTKLITLRLFAPAVLIC